MSCEYEYLLDRSSLKLCDVFESCRNQLGLILASASRVFRLLLAYMYMKLDWGTVLVVLAREKKESKKQKRLLKTCNFDLGIWLRLWYQIFTAITLIYLYS